MSIQAKLIWRIRICLAIFIFGLIVSGITAIPIEPEINWLTTFAGTPSGSIVSQWLFKVRDGLTATYIHYPFIAYGTDWLAFAHFIIAIAFIGPYREPVRNLWVIEFGLIACILVIPFAMIAGHFRGIPIGWRFLDCSFGIVGMIPLLYCRAQIKRLTEKPL